MIFSIMIILFIQNESNSQDLQNINKIIIDDGKIYKRLLSPPTEKKNEKIELIPPKSVKERQNNENLEAARKKQEEKRKALEIKKKERN